MGIFSNRSQKVSKIEESATKKAFEATTILVSPVVTPDPVVVDTPDLQQEATKVEKKKRVTKAVKEVNAERKNSQKKQTN